MSDIRKSFSDFTPEEKLIFVEAYLNGMTDLEDSSAHGKHIEWLRRHIPSYKTDDKNNYVFISYSHKDYEKVYRDLAFYLYNPEMRVRFWYDEGLPAGKDWFEAAEENLNRPSCVGAIFYLSESFLRSGAVLKEIEMIRKSGKPYITVALEENKYSAESYLDPVKDAELLSLLEGVFSKDVTLLPYSDGYDEVIYRIHKISDSFSVCEDVCSDFICEECEGGLRLVEYVGDRSVVYIPEQIGGVDLVEISARFDDATSLYIPRTVKRITPFVLAPNNYNMTEDEATIESMTELFIGGYQSPGCIFGEALNLESITVDERNTCFYSKNGVLYDYEGSIVRFPPRMQYSDEVLEGVTRIGQSAFYGCKGNTDVHIPQSVIEIGDLAFGKTELGIVSIESGVKRLGHSAFAEAKMFILDADCEIESIGEWAFRKCRCSFLNIMGKYTVVPRGAFFSCQAELISTADDVTILDHGAYALCTSCDYFCVPDKLKAIGDRTFSNCNSLYSIELPATVRYIAPEAFEGCDILKQIIFKGTTQDLRKIQSTSGQLSRETLELFVCRDQILKRIKAYIKRKRRERAQKILENL